MKLASALPAASDSANEGGDIRGVMESHLGDVLAL